MARNPEQRVFSAQEAAEVAHLVADHSPEIQREVTYIPRDHAAAEAGVLALVECLETLPGSIRSALKRAADSAAFLSDDRLQGLAELIQNADDLGATEAVVAIDGVGSRLLFSHNGTPLTLDDVWALAIPWLSLKVTDEEKLGRFGIGLKTLHALSGVLEVNQGHFRVRFSSNTIQPLERPIGWSESHSPLTSFAVPFTPGTVSSEDAVKWLRHWDDAGLVFLRHLSTVRVVDEVGAELARLQLKSGREELLPLDDHRTMRRKVSAADGRQWLVYSRNVPSPEDAQRRGKAQGTSTPLALAFALFQGDTGHIHVGLPVRAVGLPFRMLAQFDPQASRRDIADTDWNMALIPLLSDLWRDATLDLFGLAPSQGWAVVPTTMEFEADGKTEGRLRARLEEHFLRRARVELAQNLTLDDAGAIYPLSELAYEAADLTGVLAPSDLRLLSDRPGVIAPEARSVSNRWREVLADLHDIGGANPTLVNVEDASILLDDDQRSAQFVADLLAVVIEAGLANSLESRTCVVLDDGNRVLPASRTGTAVLLPAEPDTLWELLEIGSRLHPAFADHARWGMIREWLEGGKRLRRSATSTDALEALASAGDSGVVLDSPLSDAQIEGLRRTLEAVPEAERQALGAGIGRAIKVSAVRYSDSGAQIKMHVRPCGAYFIEREASTWFVAASKTPGLVWIDPRYSKAIKSDIGRDGIGAQKLFRLLGAEVAPRVVSHPANYKRLSNHSPGVPDSALGSPARRREALRHLQASFTLRDWIAPDLDAVLTSIAKEKDPAQRRRRAGAVLGTLTRAWERLSEQASVTAATPFYNWEHKGTVDAWWLSSAASIAWLPSEKGKASAPHELRIKSPATVALYGDSPERYVGSTLDTEAYREVLARIGVAGDPTVQELIHKLEDVRAKASNTPESAEDLAAPLYKALAAQVRGSRLGNQTAGVSRTAFGKGEGLIATRNGWRRPSMVLAGPPIFGEMRDFVPSVSGTDALWSLLSVRYPSGHDARSVLTSLTRRRTLSSDEKLIMLEALRLLVGAPAAELAKLRKAAVWVGDRWERSRPVYATGNALIAQGLRARVPVWSPGGSFTQLSSLTDAYKLTRLDVPHGKVLDADAATYDADLTNVFATAVTNLQSDLAFSDPKTEESVRVPWKQLAALRVKVAPNLRVRLVEPTHGLDETIEIDTWLDLSGGIFYVSDEAAIGSPSSGAYAVASVFDGDARRIAHDWLAAWSIALEGHREEEVTTAARLDAERKQVRDERGDEMLRNLAEQGKNRRSNLNGESSSKGRKKATDDAIIDAKPKLTRHLVDPESLTLKYEDGEIVGATAAKDVAPTTAEPTVTPDQPRDPDVSNPRTPSGGGRGSKNYTEQERETVGLDLVRRVLGGDEAGIVDIRHQRNVGADAIDDLENYFELKVYAGPIPDSISLTNSEFRRAQETEQFFLVVVGNVEQSDKTPVILIFTDPLNHLNVLPQGSVHLGGLRDARALRYTFESS